MNELINQTVPSAIRLESDDDFIPALSEFQFLANFKRMMSNNQTTRSFIGMGYYPCVVPSVIQRNIFENPGWYTAYTPYQAEISQGRLEALINFQSMVTDLTGMEISNASLLDEGTAAAEAMLMLWNVRHREKKGSSKFLVDTEIFPQTLEILGTRAETRNIDLVVKDWANMDLKDPGVFGVLFQYPNDKGEVLNHSSMVSRCHENQVSVAFAADLLSLTLLKSPGEMGADVVVGCTQRFGVPMGYGGPHAGYFATLEKHKRHVPGRIIGVSVDSRGKKGYRMALQTREQHIKRERATSNICTAQVLLAVMAGMFGVYHGPEGLKAIALQIRNRALGLDQTLRGLGYKQTNQHYFDTLNICLDSKVKQDQIKKLAEAKGINLRYSVDHRVGISLDEVVTDGDISGISGIFSQARNSSDAPASYHSAEKSAGYPDSLVRKSKYMTHPVFNNYHTEHGLLRYLKQLENKDLSLVHSMIPLGSCTMKLNATSEMIPISWPELANIHPFVPIEQTDGYQELFRKLESWLSEITGFSATSLQPNSGAQGEYSGLVVISAFHKSQRQKQRNIALIPSSAHGTNPASAVMAGMEVVVVNCDDSGNVELSDLQEKAQHYSDRLATLMITYPSTHGVFEESIVEICKIIHDNGGQVYMDGANMNAQVGITSPGKIGADVCHLNLHKTFCIPHGGGGPGVGPICVAEHLKPFLPGNPVIKTGGKEAISAISSAPWGSSSILAVSYAYIQLMGSQGLRKASETAILNANYLKDRLADHYDILYTGANNRCAHEFIIDCRSFHEFGIQVEDIAKRLMDYGFHAPTVSFPVPGTMMIEPTESETISELNRFCESLMEIRQEIEEVKIGRADRLNNLLKNAPHTMDMATADEWNFPYSRARAIFPLPFVRNAKFWPSIGRIDNAYGDRNLFCACIPIDALEDESSRGGHPETMVERA